MECMIHNGQEYGALMLIAVLSSDREFRPRGGVGTEGLHLVLGLQAD